MFDRIPIVPLIEGAIKMESVSGLQVYWICSRRLVYSEVVEARSNYKKSYLWWFRNSACVDSTRSNWIEKMTGFGSMVI